MNASTTRRKRRCDTRHAIYIIQRGEDTYIGVTVVDQGRVAASVRRRWLKHVNRANKESHAWRLCQAIREHGADSFTVKALEVVRGKKPAHARERELIAQFAPTLNTHVLHAA